MLFQKSEHLITMWGIRPKEDHYLMPKNVKTGIKKNLNYFQAVFMLKMTTLVWWKNFLRWNHHTSS